LCFDLHCTLLHCYIHNGDAQTQGYISYTTPRNCVNSPDNVCCICGEVPFSTRNRPVTPIVKKLTNAISVAKPETKTKKWAPHICCIFCVTVLREWLNNKAFNAFCPSHDMKGTNRTFDRLLFLYSPATSAWNYKEKKRTVNYPNILSAIRPVPHTEDRSVPIPPQQYILDSDEEPTENREKTPQPSTSTDADFTADLHMI